MKAIDQPLMTSYLPVYLQRDDLEAIERILSDTSEKPELEADGYSFDSIDEMATYFRESRVKSVNITARKPYISIELSNMEARLYASSNETSSSGLFYRCDRVIRNTRRSLYYFYSYYFVAVLYIISVILARYTKGTPFDGPAKALLLVFAAWILWVVYIRLRSFATIFLTTKREASFIRRKKDEIIIGLLLALVAALIGNGAIPYITQYFSK